MISSILKVSLLLLVAVPTLSIFLISDNNFLIAGGSDAADIFVRVPYVLRVGTLILTFATIGLYIFRTGKTVAVLAMICVLAFMLSQNTVRVSGKDFEAVQYFALLPVQRLEINDNPLPDVAVVTLSSTWCCLVSEQEGRRYSFIRGIWPLTLPEDKLRGALDGLIFDKHVAQ